ncbi:hypothetical protein BKA70DRAFT_1408131 [Coprinopsis sp. MPI-PUGE-AT-0042]|nr:hypothetical protein BKA70DRAFT_1408131 [Coprinopsis sp. MPI-PUGE-AT-0042]
MTHLRVPMCDDRGELRSMTNGSAKFRWAPSTGTERAAVPSRSVRYTQELATRERPTGLECFDQTRDGQLALAGEIACHYEGFLESGGAEPRASSIAENLVRLASTGFSRPQLLSGTEAPSLAWGAWGTSFIPNLQPKRHIFRTHKAFSPPPEDGYEQCWLVRSTCPEAFDCRWILGGSYAQVLLLAIECAMLRHYWSVQKALSPRLRDPKILVGAIGLAFFMDIVGTFGACAMMYDFLFRSWGKPNFLGKLGWAHPMLGATNTVNEAIGQTFMAYRYWTFSQNRFISFFFSFLVLVTLISRASFEFAGNISSLVASFLWYRLEERPKSLAFVVYGMSGTAVTDSAITIALLHKLWRTKLYSQETRGIVSRVTGVALITGCAPAILAIAIIIGFAVSPSTLVSIALAMPFGSVYTVTVVGTLNLRGYVRTGHKSYSSDTVVMSDHIHSRSSPIRVGRILSPMTFNAPPIIIKKPSYLGRDSLLTECSDAEEISDTFSIADAAHRQTELAAEVRKATESSVRVVESD